MQSFENNLMCLDYITANSTYPTVGTFPFSNVKL